MSFFQFKRNSILKFFKNEIARQDLLVRKHTSKKIKTIGILVDEAQFFQNRVIHDVQKNFGVSSENIELLIYRKFQKKQEYSENEFTEKDFGWSGSLKLNRLNEFVKNEYDLLINYGIEENLYLKVITLRSQSKFKIGFSSEDNRLYDLSVSDKDRNMNVLNIEAVKYLKILKKL
ncbi:DUF6913 domain-containing protein [Flavicella sediminum]|uniref:DUF6913 domain-containing protein n=1 Tax=Flavicella sediminum TaxID=2585141 RepID=UPI001121A17E|nr:hypothetical protein [Flavicella sediminum]